MLDPKSGSGQIKIRATGSTLVRHKNGKTKFPMKISQNGVPESPEGMGLHRTRVRISGRSAPANQGTMFRVISTHHRDGRISF